MSAAANLNRVLKGNKKSNPTVFFSLTILPFATLCAISTGYKLVIFFLFSQNTGFDISCKLSPSETICIKCQILYSGKSS